ncbi:fibronectin type III domain-containing protein [Rhizobium sp. MHM7A]|uniref:fibronectin type III domain-containing protein n=1 Tax=Rhizobium sp. MHM7A TaxID=2583233 RepID=UPI0011073420|nr:fibronectin type III domain-containing protein [Rhizobium sp. MHM7A]TLX12138.1 fibronectin type III domain-containing protein [Rhizobium sp. MHM7A]
MLVKTVTTVVATDSAGKPVDAIPVRNAVAGETDAAGRPVTPISVTEDPLGIPVRVVAGKAAQNSAGHWIDSLPITGGAPSIGETSGIVGSRFQVATAVGTIAANTTSRRVHYAHPLADITDLQCVDSAWYISDATLQPAAASSRTIKRYIEYPDGVFHQVLWSGASSKLIDTGSFKSDVVLSSVTGLPLVIPAGAKFAERTVNLTSSVTNFPLIEMPANNSTLGLEDGNSLTDQGNSGTISADAVTTSFGSVAIVGKIAKGQTGTPAKSYILVGDSIMFGQGDVSSAGAKGGSGWGARLLDATGMPYLKMAKKGQSAQQFAGATASVAALLSLLSYSDVICEHGVNDLRLGRTAAQILADHQTIYGLFGTANIFQTTITPRSDTTNAYADVAGQTPKTDGNMTDLTPLNTSIRAIPANVDTVLEVADAAMSARNSNVWGGPFPPVLDGTHPTSAKAAAMAALLSLNTTPTAPGQVGSLSITGAGSTTLAYSFTAPSTGSNPITYLVEYKRTVDSTWTQFVTGSSALTGTITGLTANTSYDVRVTPSNAAGSGSASTVTQSTVATFQPLDLGANLGFAWDTNDTSKVLADGSNNLTQMGEKYSSNVLAIGGAPAIITNGGQTGNKRVIDFPAGAYLKGNAFAALLDIPDGNTATSQFTIVEAAKIQAGVTNRLSFFGSAGAATKASFSIRTTTTNRGPSVIEVDSRTAVTAFQAVVETANYHVFTTIKNGTSVIFRVDGVQVASATLAGDGNWNFNDFYIGTSSGTTTPGTPATVFPPDAYSGLVIARTALSGADLTNVEAWVGATAGL